MSAPLDPVTAALTGYETIRIEVSWPAADGPVPEMVAVELPVGAFTAADVIAMLGVLTRRDPGWRS